MLRIALVLLSMGLSAASAHATSLQLTPCAVAGTTEPARCGSLEVYENRVAATGRRIPIKVVVFPARSAPPAPDPLFIIAGGPGQSATEFCDQPCSRRSTRVSGDVSLVDTCNEVAGKLVGGGEQLLVVNVR